MNYQEWRTTRYAIELERIKIDREVERLMRQYGLWYRDWDATYQYDAEHITVTFTDTDNWTLPDSPSIPVWLLTATKAEQYAYQAIVDEEAANKKAAEEEAERVRLQMVAEKEKKERLKVFRKLAAEFPDELVKEYGYIQDDAEWRAKRGN